MNLDLKDLENRLIALVDVLDMKIHEKINQNFTTDFNYVRDEISKTIQELNNFGGVRKWL